MCTQKEYGDTAGAIHWVWTGLKVKNLLLTQCQIQSIMIRCFQATVYRSRWTHKLYVSNLLSVWSHCRTATLMCRFYDNDRHLPIYYSNSEWRNRMLVTTLTSTALYENKQKLTVRLSRSSCIISVLSLYESSFSVSNSAIASSNAYHIQISEWSEWTTDEKLLKQNIPWDTTCNCHSGRQ